MISSEYFIKVLDFISMVNLVSGIIAIIVILFLYGIWKKSEAANIILYIKYKELKDERERMQNGN